MLKANSWFLYLKTHHLRISGSPSYPRNISTRMMYWYGCMLSVVVYASYSATLVSHLTVVLPTTIPFSDFHGLVKEKGWDAGNVKDDLFEVTASVDLN